MTSRWLGEYDGRYNNVIPDCVANPCATVRTGCFSKDSRIKSRSTAHPCGGPAHRAIGVPLPQALQTAFSKR